MNQLGRIKEPSEKIELSEVDVSRIDQASPREEDSKQNPFNLFISKTDDFDWHAKT